MIYLDNAATTFPKPPAVVRAVAKTITERGGNPGRGAHPLSLAAAEEIYACRELLSSFFGLGAPERVIFTENTTAALNLAIKGLFKEGDHVLLSEMEHNAVRRPLAALRAAGKITYDPFPVVGLTREEILAGVAARIRPNTRAVVMQHASNVTSLSLPVAAVGALCRKRGLLLIVDAAQSAGLLPIHMRNMRIDALAVPGHKSLYGIQGCGALLLGERASPIPLIEGGSGVDSLSESMPELPPERYEAGTLPTPAIAGLAAGIRYLRAVGEDAPLAQEKRLFCLLRERLLSLGGVKIYLPQEEGSVLLFQKADIPAARIAEHLAARGICVRAGLHCAPMAHRALGTGEDGAVRVSFSFHNTEKDVEALFAALKEL